ncbi:hypothetical protein D3C86_1954940 [compost metagenome]
MSSSVAGVTPVGGMVNVSPPRMNLPSVMIPRGSASMTWRRSALSFTSMQKFSMIAISAQSSLSVMRKYEPTLRLLSLANAEMLPTEIFTLSGKTAITSALMSIESLMLA